jgi:opacity protein-like surface antigen
MTIDRGTTARLLVATTAFFLWHHSSLAAEDVDYARVGPYVGLGLVYAPSVFDVDDTESLLGASLDSRQSFGFDARGGFRFHRHFAGEAGFQYTPDFHIRSAGDDISEVSTWNATASGKAYLMTDRFQPYAVAGIGVLHADPDPSLPRLHDEGTAFMGRFGGGADYYATPNVVITAEIGYVLPTGTLEDLRYLPVVFGAQYSF